MNIQSSPQLDCVTRIGFFRSLRGKLILLFLAVSLIPLIAVGLLTYTQARNALKTELINKLVVVRDIKAKRITKYFEECLEDVKVLSQNPFTIAAIRSFEAAILADTDDTTQTLTNQVSTRKTRYYRSLYLGKPDTVDADDGSAYSAAHVQYHPMFKGYQEAYGYYDIFLVEVSAGKIIYSVMKEDDLGSSLKIGVYAGTHLGKVFQKTVVATARDLTRLEDFSFYEPSQKISSFVASPIFDDDQLVGVLIFQLSKDRVNAIMQERTGLGETGETILISSEDFLLRSDSRLISESTFLKQKVDTEATRASANGKTGITFITDYRGEPTIVAHTPLNIPGLKWLLNAKVDEDEAFAVIQQMLTWLLIILCIGTVIVVRVAFFFSHSIAKPVQAMTHIARELADGNLNLTVEIDNQDEIGVMGTAFRQMIVNLRLVIEDIVQISQGLAQGNLHVMPKQKYRGEFVQIQNALETALLDLQHVVEDIVQTSQGLAEGNLRVRFQAEYLGDFLQVKNALEMAFLIQRQIVEDIVQVSQELAKGNLRVKHQAEYQGEFAKIRIAQETALSNLWQVIEDIVNVSQGLAESRLEILPKGEYQGDFVQIKNALKMASVKLAKATRQNATQDWFKTGQAQLHEKMRGEQELVSLTQNIINYLATYINAQVGVFFLADEKNRFQLVSSYAYQQRSHNYNEFQLGEGLIGQAALEKKSILFTQVPQGHINVSINSGLGESPPQDIFVLPLLYEQQVLGVLELASIRHFTATEIEWLEQVADNIAITLNSAQSRLRMQVLLEESQQLTLTLQTQQKEIIESEQRIRAIVDTTIDAIITIDEQGLIDSCNPATETIFGYLWSELIGNNINILMPEPHRSQHDQYLRHYLATGHSKIIGSLIELEAQRKDGSIFPAEASLVELQIGEQHFFTGILRDITDRKQAEQALQEQQEKLLTSNEELQAQSEELQTQQEKLRQINEELEERTQELKRQRDEIHHNNLALEKNQVEMEQAQATLETKAQELELANQYKSEFLANMSHELRTPLNSMLILAQLLVENKSGNLEKKQVEYVQTIHNAGSDLLALINDILDLSKVEAGKIEIHFENMPLVELVETVKQKFCHVAEQKGLAFDILVADHLPPVLHTDVHRLQQIITNLLSNAIKFTKAGEIKLIVQHWGTQGNWIAFHVSDTGIGIPKDKQEVIFDAFQQVDGTTSRRYGGTGLGLSICRQLAQLLGGELNLTSEQGKGSTFILALPALPVQTSVSSPAPVTTSTPSSAKLEPVATHASNQASTKLEQTPTKTPNFSTKVEPLDEDDRHNLQPNDKFILLIEDDHPFSRIVMELAREKDFKCLVAEDGKTGLQLAQQYQPHAIILDVGLPQLDGWIVMEKLKDNPQTRHIPVHFISATELNRDAQKMGAIGYLLKPVSMGELSTAFKKIEQFIAKTLKTLLMVVENPQRQQKMQTLVGKGEVKLTVAMTQTAAMHHLHATSYDCMILDVDIEQQTGIQLLKQLKTEDNLSQIPVIIYAERDLTLQEENILQECETNLTIKAVNSPERLLDETTLFLHQVEANLPTEQQKILRMVHDKEAILMHKKVLIVDDDVRNTFALMTFLEGKNMEVIVGETGQEALTRLDEHPDTAIVLMDIMMPEMDGYEAMRKIRQQQHFAKLPIIALTAKAMKSDKAKCIEAGANDYLSKPLDTDKLLSLMRVWLYR